MGRHKKDALPTTIGDPAPTTTAPDSVRSEVLAMSGFNSAEELLNNLPENSNTSGAEEEKPRTRKKRGPNKKTVVEPVAPTDLRMQQALERMSAFGGSRAVKSAFAITGKKLDDEEQLDVDDYFYVLSRTKNLDPTGSPWMLSIFAVILLVRLVAVRMLGTNTEGLWEQFNNMFSKDEEEKDTKKNANTPQL